MLIPYLELETFDNDHLLLSALRKVMKVIPTKGYRSGKRIHDVLTEMEQITLAVELNGDDVLDVLAEHDMIEEDRDTYKKTPKGCTFEAWLLQKEPAPGG